MNQPTPDQILALLRDLTKGDHLALLWPGPASAALCCVAYLRVSTRKQIAGEGLPDQWAAVQLSAKQRGWTIVGVYVDPAVSGRKMSRPAIEQLERDVPAGRFKNVLFFRVNRMGRNAPAMWDTADRLERRGITVQSATEYFDRTTASGRFSFNMLAANAQYSSDQLSEVMQWRLRNKAEDGYWVGQPPFGYERDGRSLRFARHAQPDGPLASAAPTRAFAAAFQPALDAPASPATIVRLLFERYAQGQHSFTSLADLLNTEGYRFQPWGSDQWLRFGRETVRGVLHNRAYAGFVSSAGHEHPGNHPAIVSEDLFGRCHDLLQARTGSGVVKLRTKVPELLTGKLYCWSCGSKLYRHYTSRSGLPYYRCSGRQRAGEARRECFAPMVPQREAEQGIRSLFEHLLLTDVMEDALLAEAAAACAPVPEPAAPTRPTLERDLRALKLKFLDGELDAFAYEEAKQQLERTNPAPAVPQRSHAPLATVVRLLKDVPTLLRAATTDEARAILAPVVERVWVEDKTIAAISATAAFEPALEQIWLLCRRGCPMGLEPTTP